MPLTLPMSHLLSPGYGATEIARYPIDEWIKEGMPCITTAGWIKPCINICQKDMQRLYNVFEVAIKAEARL
eukprot:11086575-Prorocentrum_lima.AAC.1